MVPMMVTWLASGASKPAALYMVSRLWPTAVSMAAVSGLGAVAASTSLRIASVLAALAIATAIVGRFFTRRALVALKAI